MRNILFKSIFFSGLILICIIFLPSLLLPKKIALFGGKLFGYWSSFCLKIFYSTSILIKGQENIINNENYFIACSHQSMFETFFLQTVFNSPVFILKQELLKIPIFGWYLKKIGSISISRNKTTKENLGFFDQVLKLTKTSDRPLIIFPQGTRVLPEERPPFKKGVGRIYEELKISCQPIAINSGYVWPKKGQKKSNLNLVISILKPIHEGLDKKVFLDKLEKEIYSELNILN